MLTLNGSNMPDLNTRLNSDSHKHIWSLCNLQQNVAFWHAAPEQIHTQTFTRVTHTQSESTHGLPRASHSFQQIFIEVIFKRAFAGIIGHLKSGRERLLWLFNVPSGCSVWAQEWPFVDCLFHSHRLMLSCTTSHCFGKRCCYDE